MKPIFPVVTDIVNHLFYKAEHLATIHYENGKYHLHAELNEETSSSESKPITDISIKDYLSPHVTGKPSVLFFLESPSPQLEFSPIRLLSYTMEIPVPPPDKFIS